MADLGRVLVVDDDAHIRELCRLYLTKEGFSVLEAADGPEALTRMEDDPPDLVVLDVMLPRLDGWEVLNRVRDRTEWLPVIMLTAVGDETDRVAGLEMGADDYLTKPFSPRELVARIKAVLRRASVASAAGEGKALAFGPLVVNPELRQARVGAQTLALTPKEFDVLFFLADHPLRVFSRDQLLDRVWGIDFFGDARTVDVHITRIRRKIARAGGPEHFLETVWGTGYRFNPRAPEPAG